LAWATLGIARYRRGEAEGAIKPLKTAIELTSGGDATIWFFLAMALKQSGDEGRARSWYAKANGWAVKKTPKDQELLVLRAEAAARLKLDVAPVVTNDSNSLP